MLKSIHEKFVSVRTYCLMQECEENPTSFTEFSGTRISGTAEAISFTDY